MALTTRDACHPALLLARQELHRGQPQNAIVALTRSLDAVPAAGALPRGCTAAAAAAAADARARGQNVPQGLVASSPPENSLQRERMLLLRADAYLQQQNFDLALRDAEAAAEEARGESPQAQFLIGRALYAQSKVREAAEAFDLAEALMLSPAPQRYTRLLLGAAAAGGSGGGAAVADDVRQALEERGVRPPPPGLLAASPSLVGDALALRPRDGVGKAAGPAGAGATVAGEEGRTVTYEWAQDLERWRQLRAEAHTVLRVLQQRIVPRAVMGVVSDILRKQLAQKSGRHVVIVVRNDTTKELKLDFQNFKEGTFLEGWTLPNAIPPLRTAIGGAHATGMFNGVSGVAAYTVNGSHTFLLHFASPLVGAYVSSVALVPRAQLAGSAKVPADPATKQASCAIAGSHFRAAAAQPPAAVQTFSLVQANEAIVGRAEVLAILDYAPSSVLRKAAAVSKEWRRDFVARMPPGRLYGLTKCIYPDYRCADDFDWNPWTVKDPDSVCWKLYAEPTYHEERDCYFADNNEQRTLFSILDPFQRSADFVFHFGSRRSPVFFVDESWLVGGRKATLRLGSRSFGSYQQVGDVLKVAAECLGAPGDQVKCKPMTLVRKKGTGGAAETTVGGGAGTTMSIRNRHDREVATGRQLLRTPKRGVPIAELVMSPGCDALLASLLMFVAVFRM